MQKIILASASPRRKELLEKLGVEFEIVESGFDEESIQSDDPIELAEELAIQKVLAVAAKYDDAIVIGGDTVVYLPAGKAGAQGEFVGKPVDRADAERILRLLSGTEHLVVTGVAVVNTLTGEQVAGHETGRVKFRNLSEEEIKKYAESEVWRGFAGGYAIQKEAASFVLEQAGSISAIVGFPVVLAAELLEQMGVVVEADPRQIEEELFK